MIKAICFKDVLPGDVVCQSIDERLTVSRVGNGVGPDLNPNGTINLFIKGTAGLRLSGFPDQLIGLIYRPWPKGENAVSILSKITNFCFFASDKFRDLFTDWVIQGGRLPTKSSPEIDEIFIRLCEKIEVYELGRPCVTKSSMAKLCHRPKNSSHPNRDRKKKR